ncbi:MAG: prephenate dehydratase [Prochlorotrichaceae cyanobacterium]
MLTLAHLGPAGTYSEMAAQIWAQHLEQRFRQSCELQPYSTIAQTLYAVAEGETCFAVVPVENSIEGSVTFTLDTLWQLDRLQIQEALILPILHALISHSPDLSQVQTIYSHPQALSQCQFWIETHLPHCRCVPTHSTVAALEQLKAEPDAAVISAQRAAQLYDCPVLRYPIGDHPDNCTRFWLISLDPSPGGSHTSIGFTLPANVPGALLKPLQIFADRHINLSRIESRPTKRSLGDYLFFIDLEGNRQDDRVLSALEAIQPHTEVIRILGSYDVIRSGDSPSSNGG